MSRFGVRVVGSNVTSPRHCRDGSDPEKYGTLSYYAGTYLAMHAFAMTEYERVALVDTDVLVRNSNVFYHLDDPQYVLAGSLDKVCSAACTSCSLVYGFMRVCLSVWRPRYHLRARATDTCRCAEWLCAFWWIDHFPLQFGIFMTRPEPALLADVLAFADSRVSSCGLAVQSLMNEFIVARPMWAARRKCLPKRFNCQTASFPDEFDCSRPEAEFVHFSGDRKPWVAKSQLSGWFMEHEISTREEFNRAYDDWAQNVAWLDEQRCIRAA